MKNNYLWGEVGLSLLLVALVVLFCNPFQEWWMPTMFMTSVLLCFVIVFIIFAAFIWREKARDEREEQHRLSAGRIGFLVGAGFLVVGIIRQTLLHTLDPWLLITLSAMVLAKLGARLYSELKK